MVGVMLLLLATGVPADSPGPPTEPIADPEVLRQAEQSFREAVALRDQPEQARPLFRRSAALFEELRHRGVANPALYRDEGDACLLADDLPGAILAYRRGLHLAPNDPVLQQLLAAAREQVVYPQPGPFARPPLPTRPPWLPLLPLGGGSLLACAVYSLGWLSLTRWLMLRRGPWLALGGVAFAVAFFLATALWLEDRQQADEHARPLLVIAHDGVLLRRGNGDAYPRRYETSINRGVEARLLFARNDWVQIELSGGETGWVARKDVLIDGALRATVAHPQRLWVPCPRLCVGMGTSPCPRKAVGMALTVIFSERSYSAPLRSAPSAALMGAS